jgi:glycosyltransferase involved in cell wall biosynthesis
VIPTFNRACLLQRAIRSVLEQSYPDFEIMVVDDCSTDETARAMAKQLDGRVRYIRRERKGSAAATRNAGMRAAGGELICFLDDDDEYLPAFLGNMVAAFDSAGPEVGFGWCGLVTVRDTPTGEEVLREHVWQPRFANRVAAHRSILRSHRIGAGAGLTVRRAVMERVGLFDEGLTKLEDNDYLIRLSREFDFIVVPRILAKVHLHPGPRLTTPDDGTVAAYERILERHYEEIRKTPDTLAFHHYRIAWARHHVGHKRLGQQHMRAALAATPLRWKFRFVHFLFAILGSWLPRGYVLLSRFKSVLMHRVPRHRPSRVTASLPRS